MATSKVIQTNFTGGELSPLMRGRVDTVKYQNGAAQLENFIVKQQGGAWFREGSKVAGRAQYSDKECIVYEFEYSDLQTYIIEIGHLYVRIWYDGGFVETSPGSGLPLTVTTEYEETDLTGLTFAQSADILYIFHKDFPPRKLRRLGANSWDIIDCDFQDGPYLAPGNTDITLRVSDSVDLAKAVSTGAFFTGVVLSASIINFIYSGGLWEFVCSAAHGFTTGTTINLSNLSYKYTTYGRYANTVEVKLTGTYTVTVVDSTRFTLNEVNAPSAAVWINNGAIAQTIGTSNFFEYKKDNTWYLAELLTVTDSTHADVNLITNVKTDVNRATVLTYAAGNITSSFSGIFTYDDIGKYVKISDGTWHRITAYTADDKVVADAALTLLVPGAGITISFSESHRRASVVSTEALFSEDDLNRHIRFTFGNKKPWGKIVEYISATEVTVELKALIPVDPTDVDKLYDDGQTNFYQLGAWCIACGFPRVGVFHEQRLWTGGSVAEPLNVWGSQPNDYENNAPTEYDSVVLDTNAINYSLVANKANPILWFVSGPVLLVGTLSNEWQVKAASSINQPITPTNINVTPQTNHGARAAIRPIKIGSAVLFIQTAGRKMIELIYDFQQDSFVGRDLTVVSEHLFRLGNSVVALTHQKEPNNLVWACLESGKLAALTYDKDQQVAAWHSHSLGGNGLVESIASIPSQMGTEDTVYMIVKRTINGATVRNIEYFVSSFYPQSETDKNNMLFLDSHLQYNGAPTTTITGLTLLQNETVSVIADGVYLGEKTIVGTTLTLDTAASVVNIGFKYKGIIKLLPFETQSRDGSNTIQGKIKRTGKTSIRVYLSLDFKYGKTLQNLDVYKMIDGNGTPTEKLTTTDAIVDMPAPYDYEDSCFIVQDKPYPLVVLAVMPDLEVSS